MYVPPQRKGFLRPLCLKTGIDFAHLGLESGTVLEGTRRSDCMNVFTECQFQMKWKEKKKRKLEMDFEKSFLFYLISC